MARLLLGVAMRVRRLRTLGVAALALAAAGAGGAGEDAGGVIPPSISAGEPFRVTETQAGNQLAPEACALGRGGYLAVWQEGWGGLGGRCTVRGSVVDEKGPGPAFAVSPADGIHEEPALAYADNSGRVLVAWQEFVDGRQYDIRGLLLTPEGKPAGEPFTIAAGPHNDMHAGVGSDGRDFLVVWQAFNAERRGYSLYCSRVSAEGKVLEAPASKLSESGNFPRVAFNGQDYVAVYDRGGGVHSRRVAADGKIVDADDRSVKLVGLMHSGAAAASNGREVMVSANGNPDPDPWGWGGPGCISAARSARDGTCPERALKFPGGRDAVADRTIPLLLDATAWKGRKGWPQGAPGGFKGTENGTWPAGPTAIAWTGKAYLVVWPRARLAGRYVLGTDCDLFAGLVSPDPVKSLCEPAPVAQSGEREARPALASRADGECLLLYEAGQPDGAVVIMARRLRSLSR